MTRITSAFAAALIASASFASIALADDGDYYAGASEAAATVDHVQTGSIAQGQQGVATAKAPVGNGSYYEGANRPN